MVSLTVWARDGLPPKTVENIVLWQAFLPASAPQSWISLPEIVHARRGDLRPRLQQWLKDVGNASVLGTPLFESMALRPNLSYWWMSLPADHALNAGSPAYTLTRLIALHDLLSEFKPSEIRICADSPELKRALTSGVHMACRLANTQCVFEGAGTQLPSVRGMRSLMRGTVQSLAATAAAARVFWNHLRIALTRRSRPRFAVEGGITFVDYLAHLAPSGPNGAYRSNYWGDLVELLEVSESDFAWIHIPAEYVTKASITRDLELVDTFDTAHSGHGLLHQSLTLHVLLRSFRDYLRIRRMGSGLLGRNGNALWSVLDTDVRGLLRPTLLDEFRGRSAALNALWVNLWETTLKRMPPQRLGIYLFENQPWEMAFVSAWRRAGHGLLIGYSHSTMLFWDMRYFKDSSIYPPQPPLGMPWPDRIAINGEFMRRACLDAGVPSERLVEVEALRYTGLASPAPPRDTARALGTLVVGEYSRGVTLRILEAVRSLAARSPSMGNVMMRAHPASPIPPRFAHGLTPADSGTIADRISESDLVIAGPSSTAALEAALLGCPTIVLADPDAFFCSPAEGLPAVRTSLTLQETDLEVLGRRASHQDQITANYFALDPFLPRWRSMLAWNAV